MRHPAIKADHFAGGQHQQAGSPADGQDSAALLRNTFCLAITAGEAITQGQPVSLANASGVPKAYVAGANLAEPTCNSIGLADADAASGAEVVVTRLGFTAVPTAVWSSAPSASDIGARVYLSATKGKLQLTPQVGRGAIGVVAYDAAGTLGCLVGALGSTYTPY